MRGDGFVEIRDSSNSGVVGDRKMALDIFRGKLRLTESDGRFTGFYVDYFVGSGFSKA